MDLTNRVLIVCGALIWIFLVMVVILLAWGAPDDSIDKIGDLAGYMADHNDTPAKLIVTFGGLILIMLALVVIISEVAPSDGGTLKMERVGGATARISTEEVALRLEEELQTFPQLKQVQASVKSRGQKAEVELELHVSAEAELSSTAEEACRRARQLLEERMGVALAGPPRARLHYQELKVGRSRKSPPSTPSESPSVAATTSPPEEQQAAKPASQPWSVTKPAGAPTPAEEPSGGPAGGSPSEPSGGPSGGMDTSHESAESQQEDRPAGA